MFSARNKHCTATRVASIKLCTWMAKTTPCFTPSGCVPGLYPDEDFVVTAFTRSATLTNSTGGPLVVMDSAIFCNPLFIHKYPDFLPMTNPV